MNKPEDPALADYYREAESWADERADENQRSLRIAWIVAGVLGLIALLEALALVFMMPLKQVEPYAVLVDRQTGFVQPLNLTQQQSIVPSEALVNSMLAQYVTAREGFEIDALKDHYRKVALWSAGDARSQYIAGMQATNPASPLAALPRQAIISAEIRSISPLAADSALVRFATTRIDPGSQPVLQGVWAAVIRYRFSSAEMSAASRLENPLGFQVLRYSKSAEIAPSQTGTAPPPSPQGPPAMPRPAPPQPNVPPR